MNKFLKALTNYYSADDISPGLQVSWLKDKSMYYVAIHRFKTNIQSRTILVKALGPTLDEAVQNCMDQWVSLLAEKGINVGLGSLFREI